MTGILFFKLKLIVVSDMKYAWNLTCQEQRTFIKYPLNDQWEKETMGQDCVPYHVMVQNTELVYIYESNFKMANQVSSG